MVRNENENENNKAVKSHKRRCAHGREANYCKQCGGIGLCDHGKRRDKCVACSGCEHGRLRRECKECGGSSICEHGRHRKNCKQCGGTNTNLCKQAGMGGIAAGANYAGAILSW